MGKIIAIGGGQLGVKPGTKLETLEIDQEIVRLAEKQRPKLLFIPTASSEADAYCIGIKNHFGRTLGCDVDVLYLLHDKQTKQEIEKKILSSDIVYVGGGNTLKMLLEWRRRGVDQALLSAYDKNIVLSGISAGAICWFRFGSSDSRGFKNPDSKLIKIRGLNLFNATCCPHYNSTDIRERVKQLMSKTPGVAIALQDCAAVQVVGDEYRIISSKSDANAFKVYWRKGRYFEEPVEKRADFRPLAHLLAK